MAEFTIKFRPEDFMPPRGMKNRPRSQSLWSKDYGMYTYIKPHEAFNHTLYRRLYYRGNFAPLPVQHKWEPVYDKFMNRHAPYFVRSVYKRWGRKYTGKFF